MFRADEQHLVKDEFLPRGSILTDCVHDATLKRLFSSLRC